MGWSACVMLQALVLCLEHLSDPRHGLHVAFLFEPWALLSALSRHVFGWATDAIRVGKMP